jgi:NAD(P)-dependent dehydrogenase (short-subunit alcohol dehydrogenase family)
MLAAELRAGGGQALPIPCDVGDPEAVASMVEAASREFGRLDVLVAAAGVVADGGFAPEKVPAAAFEQTVRVNVLGLWYCCQQVALRMLRDGGGSIINVASVAGLNGVGSFPPAYQASKAAVINLTRSLASSWADRGVRVNTLAPGWFPSEMTEQVFTLPPFKAWAESCAPMGRLGDPEELLGALLFLATDASRFVTGQTIAVDGGLSACAGRVPAEVLAIFAEHTPGGRGRRVERGE